MLWASSPCVSPSSSRRIASHRPAPLRNASLTHRCRSTIKTVINPAQAFMLKAGNPTRPYPTQSTASQRRSSHRPAARRAALSHRSPFTIKRAPHHRQPFAVKPVKHQRRSASPRVASRRLAAPRRATLRNAHPSSPDLTNKDRPQFIIGVNP